jgi:hypothetical protein
MSVKTDYKKTKTFFVKAADAQKKQEKASEETGTNVVPQLSYLAGP